MLEFPYPITENPDGTYHFTSDLGIKYTIALFDASFHFNHFVVPNGSIVEFSFGADSTPQFDPRITTTILAFLSNFFQNSQNVLLYVCDSLDRKQLTRKRIFEKWFSRFRTPYLEQYDFSFLLEDVVITGAVIIDVRNTEREALLKAFLESYQLYVDFKQ